MKKSLRHMVLLGLSATMLVGTGATVISAQDDSASSEETTSSVESQESASSEEAPSSDEATSGDTTTSQEGSDVQQGVQAAVDRFMEEYPNADIEEIDVDLEGESRYEIQVDGFEGENEYDLEVVWENGELTQEEFDTDNDDDDDDDNQALDLASLITIDEASDIALNEVGFGEITSWTLDSDDDDHEGPEWDIEIEDREADREAEVEIDAMTGDILNVDLDD